MELNIAKISHPENLYPEGNVIRSKFWNCYTDTGCKYENT